MASLLDLISGRMTPEVVQKLAGQAGISATDAKRAIDAIIPAQLSGLASMGSSEAGANRLLSVLKEHQGTESFAQVLLGGDAMQRQAKVGETLQSAVYGNDLGQRISSMASSLGIPQGAASSLMGMIMPVVVGLLGREVRERGLDAAGLVNLLRGERETVEGARPTELADRPIRRRDLEASRVVEVAPPARSRAWLWLLLPLLGLIALGLWYANRPPQTAVTPTMVTTTSLGGTRWHWERTRLSDGREQRPADSAAYALDFQRDGSAAVRADCNTAKGSYTTTGANLAIAPLAATKAACPSPSLSEVYLQQLQNSGTYLLRDGKLMVNLKGNAGTMEFVPAR